MGTNKFRLWIGSVVVLVFAFGLAPTTFAQKKIVCWKDASGKVVGCGDTVPPEFVNSATKELDKQGNIRKTGDSAEEATKRKALEKEQAQAKAEEQKRVAEQKRQDSALLNTFSNEKEIDLKRDREIQALDNTVAQQRAALKLANDRLTDVKQRTATFGKDKKAVPQGAKDDLARAEGDKARLEQDIAAKEKDKQDMVTKYAAFKKRYMELKGISPSPSPSSPAATTPAPATTATAPAAAKK